MAADLATLALRLTNAQAIADAKATGAALEEMGVKGEAAAGKIAASSNPVTTAIKQQAIDYTQLTARAGDFARAGASAAQVSQMAGVSMAQAAAAVKMYSGTVSKAEIDVVGLKAAQAQLALANMAVGESAVVAGAGFNTSGAEIGRLRQSLASAVSMMTGLPPIIGRIASTMGVMFVGMWEIVAVLAAIAAASWVWDKLTEGTRKATKAVDEAIDRMKELTKLKGPELMMDDMVKGAGRVQELSHKLQLLSGDIAALVAIAATAGDNPVLQFLLGIKQRMATALGKEIGADTTAMVAVAAELLKTGRDAATKEREDRVKDLEALLKYNKDDHAARSALIAQRGRDLEQLKQLTAGQDGPVSRAIRANLAGEIGSISETLSPKKDATQAIRDAKEYADAIAKAVAETNKLNIEQAKKTVGIDTDRTNADLLLAAAQQGTLAYQDQVDAIAVQNKLLADGIYWFDARYDAAKKSLEITVAERRETEAIVKATQDAATAAKEAATRAAEEAARPFKNMMRELQTEFAKFFDDIFTKGIKSFGDLVSAIKDMFLKMIAELMAANLMRRLAPILSAMMGFPAVAGAQGTGAGGTGGMLSGLGAQMAGQAAMGGLAGGAVGYGVGGMVGNAPGGAMAGAASGAGVGFMLGGPIGALAGGVAGLVGGLLGGAQAAREAAAAMRQLQKDYTAALAVFKHDDLGAALAQNAAQAEQLMQTAKKLYGDVFYIVMHGIGDLQKAYADIAAQEAKNAEIIKRKALQVPEDLQVRLLAAQGQDAAAAALQLQHDQARERQAMIDSFGPEIDATEQATLSLLDQVQAQEKLKAATDAATGSALNMVAGYKLQATIFAAMNPHGSGGSDPLGGGGGISGGGTDNSHSGLKLPGGRSPTGSGDLTVPLVLDGKVVAQVVLKNFRSTAQRQFGDSTKWQAIQ